MYYHASSVKGITQLTPQSSNHGIPLVYFSTKRENVLVYLSNSIEKYCVETGFSYDGKCQKWGPYGFGKDGRQRLEEYYPNALISTYKGVSGYIYSAETISDSGFSVPIPDVATSSIPVDISGVEFIPDSYEAILQAEREGLLTIIRYEEMNDKMKAWSKKTILEEYDKIVKMIVFGKSVFGADGDKPHCDLCFYSDCVLEKNVLSGIYGHC